MAAVSAMAAVTEVAWRFQFRSGNRIAPEPNRRLRELWREAMSGLG